MTIAELSSCFVQPVAHTTAEHSRHQSRSSSHVVTETSSFVLQRLSHSRTPPATNAKDRMCLWTINSAVVVAKVGGARAASFEDGPFKKQLSARFRQASDENYM